MITLLQRLEAKGYVACDKSRFAHVFQACVTRDQVVQQQVASLADAFYDGAASPLVLALVKGHRFSAEEIEQFRLLVDQMATKPDRNRRLT